MKLAILIILTSHARMGDAPDAEATGLWLEELAVPYQLLAAAGVDITLASPLGGPAPVDPRSLGTAAAGDAASELSPAVQAFLADKAAQAKMQATVRLADALGKRYDAVFVPGGHGTMWDLPTSPEVATALSQIYAAGGIVAAVCHGPAALVGAKKPDGTPLVAGLRVAAFSNEEEVLAGLDKTVPFLLETRLVGLGARYQRGPVWKSFAVRDGRLVTGQNPASSEAVAKAVLEALAVAH